jgi:hypothetical protein
MLPRASFIVVLINVMSSLVLLKGSKELNSHVST